MTASPPFVTSIPLPAFPLWDRISGQRVLTAFEIEVTARCNNNCRHCYVNLPAGDRAALARELTLDEIAAIAGQAVDLGALWCLITGGEPLLRDDFSELYLALKRLGLLVSVFTNAALVTEEHVRLFRTYPPHAVEVTVYGASQATYERVTRRPGSYAAFRRGLDLLLQGGVPVRLKAMALRSNLAEFPAIAQFCRERTVDQYRFDPFLHLRLDGDPGRNAEIAAERLTPQEIVALERADPERLSILQNECDLLVEPGRSGAGDLPLLRCGAGAHSFGVSYDGRFRLCSSLCHPACVYDLKRGSLEEAWRDFVPRVRALRTERPDYLERCGRCRLLNLCPSCPATAYLEGGELDAPVEAFCRAAHARARALGIDDE